MSDLRFVDWKQVAKLPEREQMRAWVENWKRVGPELERIKTQELRAMTEEQGVQRALRVMNSRINNQGGNCNRRRSSGLVEQQRIFAQAREAQ